eukprot:421995_1
MDAISITAIILTSIRLLVMVPIMIYGLYLFNKYSNHDLLKYRSPLLMNLVGIVTIITQVIERTLMLCITTWQVIPGLDIEDDVWVVYFIFSIFFWLLFGTFAIKVYNLYYEQQYNISIADMAWKKDINPQNVDWHVTNKNTWGNTIWLLKICSIPYIVSCATDALFPLFFGAGLAFDFFHMVMISIPVCVAFIVLYKARSLKDLYRIRDEIFYQSVLVLIGLVGYTVLFLVCHLDYFIDKYGVNLQRFEWTMYSFLTDICAVSFAIVPTLYPIYLIKHRELDGLSSSIRLENDIHMGINSMNQIISEYESFKMFMDHLVSAFSAECLLFLVELIQIKHDYQKRNNWIVKIPKRCVGKSLPKSDILGQKINKDECIIVQFNLNPFNGKEYTDEKDLYFTYLFNETGSIHSKISLPIQIPKSFIVTQNENNLYLQMLCLYTKYIERLNVSYKTFEVLDNVFQQEINDQNCNTFSEEDTFNAMDECAIEIIKLLQWQFARFISKKEFNSILQHMKKAGSYDTLTTVEMHEILNSKDVPIITTEKSPTVSTTTITTQLMSV